jgi:hypothetical protein
VLEISGTWNNLDTITMGIFADGFTFTGQNQITLYKDTTTHMKIMALSADGTNAETTFDPMPLY